MTSSWHKSTKRIAEGVERVHLLIEFDALEVHRSFAEASLAGAIESLDLSIARVVADLDDEQRDSYYDHMYDEYENVSEVLPRLQWNSEFLLVYSTFEHMLNELCRVVQKRSDFELSFKDLGGSGIERAKNYLSKVAGVKTPFDKPNWQRAKLLGEIRNAIAHRNGEVDCLPNDKKSLGARLSKESYLQLKKHIPEQEDAQMILSSEFIRQSIAELRDVMVNVCNYELYNDESSE